MNQTTRHTYTALLSRSILGVVVPYIRRKGHRRDTNGAQWPVAVREYLQLNLPLAHRTSLTWDEVQGLTTDDTLLRVTRRPYGQVLVTFTVPAPVPPTPQYLLDAYKALDAYGHLNWTVGNEDWTACFDAIRADDRIVYHVVVNCESGGFIDTLETGDVAVAEAVDQLRHLPDYWAGICMEHYADSRKREHRVGTRALAQTTKAWLAHLTSITQTSRLTSADGLRWALEGKQGWTLRRREQGGPAVTIYTHQDRREAEDWVRG